LQNCKRYFHRSPSSAVTYVLFQLEDENIKLQEEITSNVRQFNENEKQAESLLDVLDEVWVPSGFITLSHLMHRFSGSGNVSRRMT